MWIKLWKSGLFTVNWHKNQSIRSGNVDYFEKDWKKETELVNNGGMKVM